MSIVGAFDLHRRQITFDYLSTDTGEVRRGRITPADRAHLRDWLKRLAGESGDFSVEGCTGWRFVIEELAAAGLRPHVAEPTDTATARGRKRRAKTDQGDAQWQRELLIAGKLPESWIPPNHVLEVRTLVRLYVDLLGEHIGWRQRLQATLFHQGVTATSKLSAELVDQVDLSPAGRDAALVSLRQLDRLAGELDQLRRRLHRYASRQAVSAALASSPRSSSSSPLLQESTTQLPDQSQPVSTERAADPNSETRRGHRRRSINGHAPSSTPGEPRPAPNFPCCRVPWTALYRLSGRTPFGDTPSTIM